MTKFLAKYASIALYGFAFALGFLSIMKGMVGSIEAPKEFR